MSRLTEKLKVLSPKAKQYLVLGTIAATFLGIVFAGMSLWDSQPDNLPPKAKVDLTTKNIAAPGAQVDSRDVWMSQSSQQLKEMEATIQGLQSKIAETEQAKSAVAATAPENMLPQLPQIQPMPPTVPSLPPLPNPIPEPKGPPGIASFDVSDAEPEAAEKKEEGAKTYIPAGSFMRVVLLGGLDAPTGGQSQNDPQPVLMRVQDNAFLPNRYRARVKECFMLGSGHGDISSERAKIRLESISCVLKTGEVVDTTVKGYVQGEDGKGGMRGRLVSKQGQVLANALMTGVIAGIGQGIQQSATTYGTTALGTTSTINPSSRIQAGVGAGVGKALDRLSQYYISLAEKMFPVIEIDAGRVVEVVLTKGFSMQVGGVSSSEGNTGDYSEVWKRGRQIMGKSLNPDE